jgi:hypothetical protein
VDGSPRKAQTTNRTASIRELLSATPSGPALGTTRLRGAGRQARAPARTGTALTPDAAIRDVCSSPMTTHTSSARGAASCAGRVYRRLSRAPARGRCQAWPRAGARRGSAAGTSKDAFDALRTVRSHYEARLCRPMRKQDLLAHVEPCASQTGPRHPRGARNRLVASLGCERRSPNPPFTSGSVATRGHHLWPTTSGAAVGASPVVSKQLPLNRACGAR